MDEFRVSEKFRLEIHWQSVKYSKEGIAFIQGCYLDGPVIKLLDEVKHVDYIDLDFAFQYVIFVNDFYIAKFSWEGVKHIGNQIYLNNVVLKNKNINTVPKLKNDDYIIADTKQHENEKHQYNLTYTSYLLSGDGSLYKFGGK